jgi:hypothetical protein
LTLKKVPGTGESREVFSIDSKGTLLTGNLVYHPIRVCMGNHLSVKQEASIAVSFDEDLTLTAHRVLRYLDGILGYENTLPITQKGVADALHFHRQQVNLAFRMLLQKGLLEKIEVPGLKTCYRMNPHYGWRGKHMTWNKALGNAPPLVLKEATAG